MKVGDEDLFRPDIDTHFTEVTFVLVVIVS